MHLGIKLIPSFDLYLSCFRTNVPFYSPSVSSLRCNERYQRASSSSLSDRSTMVFSWESILPYWRAFVGHMTTHGGPPAARSVSSQQRSHFCIIPSVPNWGTWKGHASRQLWQPLHPSRSTMTTPLSGRFSIAPVGQALTQAGSTQCIQDRESEVLFTRG